MERQAKADMNYHNLRNYEYIPVASTVSSSVRGWDTISLGTVIDKGDHNHNDQKYRVWVSKTGWLITRNSKNVKETPIKDNQ